MSEGPGTAGLPGAGAATTTARPAVVDRGRKARRTVPWPSGEWDAPATWAMTAR